MRARLNHFAIIQHKDAIGTPHRGQSMRDRNGGPPFRRGLQRLLHHLLALGVQGARRFVQEKNRWIPDKGARDGDALALTPR